MVLIRSDDIWNGHIGIVRCLPAPDEGVFGYWVLLGWFNGHWLLLPFYYWELESFVDISYTKYSR